MIDAKQFASLQKMSSKSFHQQKNLIKNVMAGKKTFCPECDQLLVLTLPDTGEPSKLNKAPGISCVKGCTDIQLDFSS
ncbi:MAG: hypothetical protein HRT37_09590 [Alteromonadaceae bacterium]|nr:hypothetical protein [Alteromonadaceae bacterium]